MFENKKIFILGMARSGYECAKLLSKYNNEIVITDIKEQDNKHVKELKKLGVKIFITDNPLDLIDDTYDYVVKNPGIKKDHPLLIKAREYNIKIINEVEVSYHFLNKDISIIGVTGSNGKTTVVNLIYDMLKKEKDNVYLGGNIGTPLSNFALNIKKGSFLVIEISDHQLCDMYDFKTNISVLTNISPTHLDFHDSYDTYKLIKKRIFNNHTNDDIAIINKDNEESIKLTSDIVSSKVYFGKEKNCDCYYDDIGIYYNNELVVELDEILLKGNHNYENIMASICSVKKYNISNQSIKEVLKEFKGVEHRLEFVKVYNGIKFYNDSKATNCVSTNIALKSFKEPTILILGGLDRGHSFYDLKDNIGNVKYIMAFGETKNRIEQFAKDLDIPCYKEDTLEAVMNKVKDVMKKNDVVLFSPACASWDQYKDFEERGLEFKKFVEVITSE